MRNVIAKCLHRLCRPLMVVLLLGGSALAFAQGESLSGSTYNKLTDIQALMAEEKTAEALTELRELREAVDPDTMDLAMVLQMLGYLELGRDNYPKALELMRASLDIGKLPEQMKVELGYMVAQLYAAQEQFAEAIRFAREWFETLEDPQPQQLMFMANLLAQTERYADAIPFAEQAVTMTDDPQESWYQLLIAATFQLEEYDKAARFLRGAAGHWPEKPQYWEQLASVYLMLEQQDKALASLQLAWRNGVLEKENSVRSLVQLAIAEGIPDRAGRFLEAAFEQELIPREETFLGLSVSAWNSAREYDKAVAALQALAEATGEGDPYLRIANIRVEQARWADAVAALERAQKLPLEKPGQVWLTLGIALTEQENFEAGLDALRKARAYDDTREQASGWLKYAEGLRRQSRWQSRNNS
ncbi:tetratricopeptide repeat protein [Marinimicrobium agarilyticum]|uniref:tetratricopeptide repeat protein n=1 Tax=Marinimicrobium agarilyticum TaxID=306546 RepID=UPI0003FC68A0|nr:tetratricopeptide repeat protein [Marinimicrobium agarilyticum]